jgi:hypothetical protein
MPGAPLVIQHAQSSPVIHILAAIQQGRDPLRIDLQGGHFLPQPSGHRPMAKFKLGRRQLAHEQKHQLLFLALSKAACKSMATGPQFFLHNRTDASRLHGKPSGPLTDSLLLAPRPADNPGVRPAMVDGQTALAMVANPGANEGPLPLADPGSEERWHLFQRLRRNAPAEPWIEALASGTVPVAPDLLAALWSRLDHHAVARLLSSVAAADATPWLMAGLQELPALASQPAAVEAWLEPLLHRQATADGEQALLWLQVVAQLRDPRVAARLRQVLAPQTEALPAPGAAPNPLLPLLPLLGLQRQPQDLDLLIVHALRPGQLAWRRAALEGLALGLSSWPPEPLAAGLETLVGDLDPGLAAEALDLLARLPQGQCSLRRLRGRQLDTTVMARLRRRLRPTPLVLLVHGRQGGAIPAELEALAMDLADRRGAPVLLQALTAEPPEGDGAFWAAARHAAGLTLVPLLLLPGGHVRSDLPAVSAIWRTRGAAAAGLPLRRLPFLGAWPSWQTLLSSLLQAERRAGSHPLWLHHPLEGPLGQRYIGYLNRRLEVPGLAAPYSADPAMLPAPGDGSVWQPLTLASNRLTESLHHWQEGQRSQLRLLPPLLQQPPVRQYLIETLEALP